MAQKQNPRPETRPKSGKDAGERAAQNKIKPQQGADNPPKPQQSGDQSGGSEGGS